MALFRFSKYNDIEKASLQSTQIMLTARGMTGSQAKKIAKDMLKDAIAQSKKEGTYYLPQNFGDIILGHGATDDPVIKTIAEKIRQKLPRKRQQGVRDEDVRWWWNLNDIERRMMLGDDDISRLACFTYERDESNEPCKEKALDMAAAKVRKSFPIYGVPEDTASTKGDDRPLYYELKDRVNIYIEKRAKNDPDKFKQEISESSTLNALIRREIRAGKI